MEIFTHYLIQFANTYSRILIEGRDIGTVILPNADIKIFLFADGYVGDALTACREQRNRQVQNTRVIGLSRFRRDLNEYFSSFFA